MTPGLDDRRLDPVAVHLESTLRELGVAEPLVAEGITVAASTRDEVL